MRLDFNILTFFGAFALAYNYVKAHTTLAIVFDLHFKNMKILLNFIGDIIAL
jgi:exonuclease V gamma subunit